MSNVHWSLVWALIIFTLVFAEGLALGTGHPEYTFSWTVALVRHDPIGRFVFWALWGFLTAHFGFSPTWLGVAFNWRAVVGISLGLAIAIYETAKIVRAARVKSPAAAAVTALRTQQTLRLAQTRATLLKFKFT
jgi:hypothetical protein